MSVQFFFRDVISMKPKKPIAMENIDDYTVKCCDCDDGKVKYRDDKGNCIVLCKCDSCGSAFSGPLMRKQSF